LVDVLGVGSPDTDGEGSPDTDREGVSDGVAVGSVDGTSGGSVVGEVTGPLRAAELPVGITPVGVASVAEADGVREGYAHPVSATITSNPITPMPTATAHSAITRRFLVSTASRRPRRASIGPPTSYATRAQRLRGAEVIGGCYPAPGEISPFRPLIFN
jgi:hypothetical protein